MRLNQYLLLLLLSATLIQNTQANISTPIKFGASSFATSYLFLKAALSNNTDFELRESVVTASFIAILCIVGKAANSNNDNDFRAVIAGMLSALIAYKKFDGLT